MMSDSNHQLKSQNYEVCIVINSVQCNAYRYKQCKKGQVMLVVRYIMKNEERSAHREKRHNLKKCKKKEKKKKKKQHIIKKRQSSQSIYACKQERSL
jgi:hypothetical protein